MSQFGNYTEIVFDAFCLHNKHKEIIDRKQEILDKISEFYNVAPESYLFIGFNPAILSVRASEIFVTEVSDKILEWLKQHRPEIKLFEELRTFDCVVAVDEYFTFAKTDKEQSELIASACKLTNSLLITTVKDYKNQDFKDREYSQPALVRGAGSLVTYVEIHDWSQIDRNSFVTSTYKLSDQSSTSLLATSQRRPLYFKQMAKFCLDAGATDFLVHKNLMFKSLIKKNYEHVISVQFENL